MCATKPPPSRCVIGINFPAPWTRVCLPDDGLLAAPEGRLHWHLHRQCTMHALRGVRLYSVRPSATSPGRRARRVLSRSPSRSTSSAGSSSSGPMPPSTRRSLRWPPVEHQQRRHRTPACAASDGHNKDGTSPNYGKKHHRSSGSVRSSRAGSAASQSSNAARKCSRDGKDFYVCAGGVRVFLRSTSASAITCVQPGAPFTCV